MQRLWMVLWKVLAQRRENKFFAFINIFRNTRINFIIPLSGIINRHRWVPYLLWGKFGVMHTFYVFEQLVGWVADVEFLLQKWYSGVIFLFLSVQDFLLIFCQLAGLRFCLWWRHRVKWWIYFWKLLVFDAGVLCVNIHELVGNHGPVLEASSNIFLTIRKEVVMSTLDRRRLFQCSFQRNWWICIEVMPPWRRCLKLGTKSRVNWFQHRWWINALREPYCCHFILLIEVGEVDALV